jgi:5-amino-6-(5-phospho-D-ribitylamino)uracil phosphatase
MIVTDLDNTILHKDKSLSEYSKIVLKNCREKGIITVAATARYFLAVKDYIQCFDYMISNDGAIIYQNSRYLWGKKIPQKVIDLIAENAHKDLAFVTKKTVYHNINKVEKTNPLYRGVYIEKLIEFHAPVFKIISKKENINSCIMKTISQCGCRVAEYRDGDWVAIVNNDVNKYNAIIELGNHLGIKPEQVVAFGDDNNDYEMIKHCGLGIVVDNGVESVKKIADKVIESNESDGVAKYIEDVFFGVEI